MKKNNLLIKKDRITFFFILLGIYSFVGAQTPEADTTYSDTIVEEFNSYFSFDISYTNNNLSSKSIQSSNSSATMADVSFYHTSGLWASAMPVLYINSILPSYDIDAMAGYQYFFSNGFDINTYYVYHYYTGDSAFMGIDYKHSLNLAIGYNYKGLYAYADAYSLWGNSDNYFSDLGIGYYKDFYLGKNKQNYLSVFPLVSFSFGTDYWIYNDFTPTELYDIRLSLKQNGYSWDTFEMQNFDIMIPIGFTHNNFTTSISYLYSIATSKYNFLGWENQSSVMVSVNYLLNIK